MKDDTENKPPRKRQRKQVHEEVEEISGDNADDGDFQVEPLKLVMFSINLVCNLMTIYLIRNNQKK
jgi:hypothetical protein